MHIKGNYNKSCIIMCSCSFSPSYNSASPAVPVEVGCTTPVLKGWEQLQISLLLLPKAHFQDFCISSSAARVDQSYCQYRHEHLWARLWGIFNINLLTISNIILPDGNKYRFCQQVDVKEEAGITCICLAPVIHYLVMWGHFNNEFLMAGEGMDIIADSILGVIT